jgi:hypothetical protein
VASAQPSASKTLYEIHGWLMWGAFTVIFPLGILIARLGRHFSRRWVVLHILTQVVGALALIAGFLIAVIKFDAINGWNSGTHPILGCFILGLVLLQPINGLIRPHVGSKLRLPWYLLHFTLGIAAVGLSWYQIWLGVRIYTNFFGMPNWMRIALGAQMAVTGYLIFLLYRWEHMGYQSRPETIVSDDRTAPSEGYGNVGPETAEAQATGFRSRDGVPPKGWSHGTNANYAA